MIRPTARQRQAKARFWQRYEKNPILGNPEGLSGPEIARLSGHVSLYKDLKNDEELWNWFFDKDYAAAVLNSGLEIAVTSLIEICEQPVSREFPSSTKVKAAETLMKYGGMAPSKDEKGKFRDEEIANMDQKELEKYVSENVKSLKAVSDGKKSS